MYISHYGKKACRSIVHFGTKVVIHCEVKHKKIRRTKRVSVKKKGHLIGKLDAVLKGSSSKIKVSVGSGSDLVKYECTAPLLRSNDTLESGTTVIIMQDENDSWHIIAAQCPEEEETETPQ